MDECVHQEGVAGIQTLGLPRNQPESSCALSPKSRVVKAFCFQSRGWPRVEDYSMGDDSLDGEDEEEEREGRRQQTNVIYM